MVWLDRKQEFKKMILTLNTYNLEFIGVFKFLVRDKKVVKLQGAELPQFCLFLSTETGDYGSTVIVPRKKYDQAKVDEFYGLCGIIRNINYDDFIFVTENTNPYTAINQVVRRSWGKLLFFMIILGLCIGTLLIFMYPILHLSWN